jgi:ubiquinone/menaquinone biosynthesis C-methylase UbiE
MKINNSGEKMTKINIHEEKVANFYDEWQPFLDEWNFNSETYGIHYGYYENGIKSYKEAVLNMNNYVGELLDLDKNNEKKILDAGCGVGGTSIYLAKKYSNAEFTGITVAPGQVKLAKNNSKKEKLSNVKFILTSFLKTDFPDNYFDGIFALESSSYAENHDVFIDEMYRVLKPGGRLVVIDGFLTGRRFNNFTKKVYNNFCIGYGGLNFPYIDSYERYLENKGFEKIFVKNISKNVRRSFLVSFLIAAPHYTFDLIKNLTPSKPTPSDTHKESKVIGKHIYAALIGISGTVGYYATSAVKQPS